MHVYIAIMYTCVQGSGGEMGMTGDRGNIGLMGDTGLVVSVAST